MAERTLFQSGSIVTMDDNVSNLSTGDLLVQGDRIEAIAPHIPAEDVEVTDATGHIILPGFIDAHHHVWLGVMRRLMPNLTDIYAYFDLVSEKIDSKYRPLDTELSTLLTAIASLDCRHHNDLGCGTQYAQSRA
jgi:5-methylthioadenosine/S-adenosylhomocysteine deaminase